MQKLAAVTSWRARTEKGEITPLLSFQPGMGVVQGQTILDLNSLEFRSRIEFVETVRRNLHQPLLEEGYLKIVSLPLSTEVRMASDRGGEFVKEVARRWG